MITPHTKRRKEACSKGSENSRKLELAPPYESMLTQAGRVEDLARFDVKRLEVRQEPQRVDARVAQEVNAQ